MSETVDIHIARSDYSYAITIGQGYLNTFAGQLLERNDYSSFIVLSDEATAGYADEVASSFTPKAATIQIVADEASKSIETVERIWTQLHELSVDRKALLINVGGGVLSDIGGFAASTYLRGIDFVNVPTTLLAAADASIGGKTGVNFKGLKNMIGTFTQPVGVYIDVDTFKTLDERVMREGLGEIIKHGAISDAEFFGWLSQRLPDIPEADLITMLKRSCELKASVVAGDERESSKRREVNFGHTIGHAIESLSHQFDPIYHGEAVAIGMVAESRLGEAAGITEAGTVDRLTAILGKAELPTDLPEWLTHEDLIKTIAHDKKAVGTEINWTLISSIGHVLTDQKLDNNLLRQLF